MSTYMPTLLVTLIDNIFVMVVIAYLITRARYFGEILEGRFTLKNQGILILIFGAFSVFGTLSGFEVFGVMPNVRDLGPMVGGLTGGPLIGLGAGLIGGVHRYFLGGMTAVPCSIATILAGLFGGLIYLLNRSRFVGIAGSVAYAAVMEAFHTILTLALASPDPVETTVIMETGASMIVSSSLGMLVFAFMISNLIKEKETAEERDRYHEELEQRKYELKIAREIQESFLPGDLPHLRGYDLAAASFPAREVGGDFYDIIQVSDRQVGLIVGDVSGKSVPAALFMALSRTVVRASVAGRPVAREAVEMANNLIASDAKSGMFVTLFYAVLDLETGVITYVNAGHNPPLVLKGETGEITMLRTGGIALGVLKDAEMEERTLQLDGGDLVLFYTDGLTEAVGDDGSQFGVERLEDLVRENQGLSAADLLEKASEEVVSFSGHAPQFDDMTMMVLRALGRGEAEP